MERGAAPLCRGAAFAGHDRGDIVSSSGDRVTFELVRLDPGTGALVDDSFSFALDVQPRR